MNIGFGNTPNRKWQGGPAGKGKMENNIVNICQPTRIYHNEEPPGCTNPPSIKKRFLRHGSVYLPHGTQRSVLKSHHTRTKSHPRNTNQNHNNCFNKFCSFSMNQTLVRNLQQTPFQLSHPSAWYRRTLVCLEFV